MASIFSQVTQFKYEVIAIDSGSSDRSVSILQQFPVRIHTIPNDEFGHGRTRNLGVSFSQGTHIVFLTQDATPANEFWLDNIVESLTKGENVAGAYSRQIPRQDSYPCERRDVEMGAPVLSIVKKVNFSDTFQKDTYLRNTHRFILFSNVSSCISKKAALEIPFNSQIPMMEDQDWCKRAIEAGYTVIYDATSVVIHSHNFSLRNIFQRHFDYGDSFKHIVKTNMSFANVLKYTLLNGLLDIVYIWRQSGSLRWKLYWSGKAFLTRFAMRYGYFKGLKLET